MIDSRTDNTGDGARGGGRSTARRDGQAWRAPARWRWAISTTVIATLAFPTAGHGQERAGIAPFEDQAFTERSVGNDPDLILVRERFDPIERTQSIYLRLHDGDPEHECVSGYIVAAGASIVAVLHSSAALLATDEEWGLDIDAYGHEAWGRGMEGVDPWTYVPQPGDDADAVRQIDAHTVRFWLGVHADIDDFRVLLRYPDEPAPASLSVRLYHTDRPDPDGWPPTSQAGIHVGSLVDAVPDDGDYSEVYEIAAVKLHVEDLDIVEDRVLVGRMPQELVGGLAGPAPVTLENFADAIDPDGDNGFDQNGMIAPIPSGSDVTHVRWSVTSLQGTRHQPIASDRVALDPPPPTHLPLGGRAIINVTVDVPDGQMADQYVGQLVIWEDNLANDQWDADEPGDEVEITVTVGDIPDGGPFSPPADVGADAGTEESDGSTDRGPPRADVPDASAVGPTDSAGAFGDGRADDGQPSDGQRSDHDVAAFADGGADRRPPRDATPTLDWISLPDLQSGDGASDSVAMLDVPRGVDGFPGNADSASSSLGQVRGGGMDCNAAPPRGADGSRLRWILLLTPALLMRLARRWRSCP